MPKRGLIILVLTWCVLLFAPIFGAQNRKITRNFGGEIEISNNFSYATINDWEAIKTSHPNNAQLAFMDLKGKKDNQKPDYWRDLDALLARFPDDLNLRRARLIESTNSLLVRPVYLPVTINNSERPPTAADRKASETWQNDAQRAAIVKAAREGARQAPNDGFFPWMEAMALWNRDDEAALKALERAAVATDFNDGVMDNQRELLQLREGYSPLDWSERLETYNVVLLPHYAPMRALAREVTWSGIAHYRRGDKAGAYRRWRIALEAGGAFRRAQGDASQSSLIGLFVSEAVERLVWNYVATELTPFKKTGETAAATDAPDASVLEKLSKTEKSEVAKLRAFEKLARSDGQGDLANYAARESAAFEARKLGRELLTLLDKLGYQSPVAWLSVQTYWIGGRVLWLGILGFASLSVCLIWRRFVGTVSWPRASGGQIAFFGALWTSVFAFAAWQSANEQIQKVSQYDDTFVPWLSDAIKSSWPFGLAVALFWIASIALCYGQEWLGERRLREQNLPRVKGTQNSSSLWLIVLGGVWLAVLISGCLWAVVLGQSDPMLGWTWTIFSILAIALTIYRVERGDASVRNRARLCVVSAFCALIAFGLRGWLDLSNTDLAFYIAGIILFVGAAILIYLGVTARLWRPLFARNLAVSLQTLGGVAAVCAVALLLASLAALPIRARQNRVVDDYIARGEIDWIRSQIALRKTAGNQSK